MIFQSTYGITDDLEVNLTLPVLFSRLSIGSMAHTFTRNPNDNSLVPTRPSSVELGSSGTSRTPPASATCSCAASTAF